MHQITMTIDTLSFHARHGIQGRFVRLPGAAAIGNVQQVAMSFLALGIFKRGVGRLAVFFTVIGVDDKVLH